MVGRGSPPDKGVALSRSAQSFSSPNQIFNLPLGEWHGLPGYSCRISGPKRWHLWERAFRGVENRNYWSEWVLSRYFGEFKPKLIFDCSELALTRKPLVRSGSKPANG